MGSSEAALLQKLSIRPFTYGLVIDCVYDNGSVFDAAVLDLTDADLANKFSAACGNVAAVCLEIGFPTLASLPHSIANAFRAMVGVVIEGCDTYSFDAADTIKVRRVGAGRRRACAISLQAFGGGVWYAGPTHVRAWLYGRVSDSSAAALPIDACRVGKGRTSPLPRFFVARPRALRRLGSLRSGCDGGALFCLVSFRQQRCQPAA